MAGDLIFSTMFQKNTPQQVLKFLDNESNLAEDLKIITSLPSLPFLKAAFQEMIPWRYSCKCKSQQANYKYTYNVINLRKFARSKMWKKLLWKDTVEGSPEEKSGLNNTTGVE